jgi:hypothetical protein
MKRRDFIAGLGGAEIDDERPSNGSNGRSGNDGNRGNGGNRSNHGGILAGNVCGRVDDSSKPSVVQAREKWRRLGSRSLARPRHRRLRQVQGQARQLPRKCIFACSTFSSP